MKRFSKLFTVIFAIVLLFNMAPTVYAFESIDNFSKINTYLNGQFTDVKISDWFNNDVGMAYELGLMQGNSNTTFSPNDDITLAESIVLACRLYSIYYGDGEKFPQGTPWYQVYVDYALKNKIITYGYKDYTKSATRAEFAQILSRALPSKELDAINTVEDGVIPDVPKDKSYTPNVYLLYRAGILSGNDSVGTFSPDTCVKRSEAAAIVSRIADSSLRKRFELKIKLAETIALSTDSIRLEIGQQVKLTAKIHPLDTTDKSISWSSSRPNIASVSDDGIIIAHNPGATLITSTTANGKVDTCYVTVSMKRIDANGTKILAMYPEDKKESIYLPWGYLDIAFSENVKSIKSNSDIELIDLSTGERIYVRSEIGVTSKINFLVIPAYILPLDTSYSLYIPKNSIQMEDGTVYGEDIFLVFKTAKSVVDGTVISSKIFNKLDVVLKNSEGNIFSAYSPNGKEFFATDLPDGQYSIFIYSKDCGTVVVREGQIIQVTVQYE